MTSRDRRRAPVVHDGDPVDFSISKNRHRRHMDKTDLAFAGAKLATLKRGSNRYQPKVEGFKKPSTLKSDAAVAQEPSWRR